MNRFVSSMTMDYEKWRDGLGYDLDALRELDDTETQEAVEMLAARLADGRAGWYDLEALAAAATPAARSALAGALRSVDAEIRLRAATYLAEMPASEGSPRGLSPEQQAAFERDVIGLLKRPWDDTGIDLLMRLAEDLATPAVKETLLWVALDGRKRLRVHAAALALYLAGGASSSFDWDQRPLFLEFGEDDRKVREAAYQELVRRMEAAKPPSP